MFTIVFFEKATRKVYLAMPLIFEGPTGVRKLPGITWEGFAYEIFADSQPVYYTDEDGDTCLKENAFIANSNSLCGYHKEED